MYHNWYSNNLSHIDFFVRIHYECFIYFEEVFSFDFIDVVDGEFCVADCADGGAWGTVDHAEGLFGQAVLSGTAEAEDLGLGVRGRKHLLFESFDVEEKILLLDSVDGLVDEDALRLVRGDLLLVEERGVGKGV